MMAKGITITGVKAIDKKLAKLEPKVQRRVVRKSMRKSMKDIQNDIRRVARPRIGWVPQAQEAIPSAKVL